MKQGAPFKLTCLMFLMSLSWGCAFGRGNVGDEISSEDVARIQKGVTTRAEVASILGSPDRIIQANQHDIFHYYHYDSKSGSLLLIVVNFARLNIKSDDVYVLINHNGVVDEVLFGKRTDRLEFQFWPFGD